MGHISTVEVRYAETDQMGIAHHSNYAVWFEVARTDFIKAAGISYTDVEKEGIITPLTSLECKYKKAAFYEDQLQIYASLTKLSPVRLEFSYKVTRDGDLIATGKTTHGMVTKDLKLSDRIFKCDCGYTEDRDFNAALNLRDATTYEIA